MYFLAREYGSGPVFVHAIAEQSKVSVDFLHVILAELRNAGLVTSRRGKIGGYRLTVSPDRISLASIICAIDGPLMDLECLDERSPGACLDCVAGEACETRLFMGRIRKTVSQLLDKTSLLEACSRAVPAGL
jgi:Rrf2 family protein